MVPFFDFVSLTYANTVFNEHDGFIVCCNKDWTEGYIHPGGFGEF